MTETRLRTLTNAVGYGLAALFIASLAVQNLRYGLYGHFFTATALAALMACGVIYTLMIRRHQLQAPGHLPMLALAQILVLAPVYHTGDPALSYWSLPVFALAFLILSLRQALALTLPFALLLAIYLLLRLPAAEALTAIAAILVLLSGAALAIWHYDHIAQSAEDLAITDPVTGAHNVRFLTETLQKEISRAAVSGHSLSVIVLAVDHLKQIRDLLSEESLQLLYRHLSSQLFGVIRAGDSLYFMGNGRFCLILPFTPEEGARVSAERIRRALAESEWPGIGRGTVSLGCTTLESGDRQADEVLARASHGLEQASQRGQDRLWFTRATPDPS